MRKKFLQLENQFRLLCGFLLFPLFLILLMCRAGIQEYNFTGLLNLPRQGIYIKAMACMILVWVLRTVWILACHRLQKTMSFRIRMILFTIFAIGAIVTPYVDGSFDATMHLFFSYGAAIFFNIMLYALYPVDNKIRTIYLAILFFCALLCVAEGKITGLSELIYACMVSILLSYDSKENDL